MTTQRTTTEIAAELAEMRAARSALVKGERVEDVWRDGSRMRLSKVSLDDINGAITDLLREYEQAAAVEAGKQRHRAIRMDYQN